MTINQLYRKVLNLLDRAFKQELREQGHHNTGKLEGSIVGKVYKIPGGDQLKGTALGYAGILNNGVSADRVPYNPGSGAGTSRFIGALILYFRQKGLSDVESKRAAFATAIKMKKEGSPTRGSFAYSKNGYRTRFIELVASAVVPTVNEVMRDGMHEVVRTAFHKTKSERI